jgi:hypothetical protein
MRLMISAFVVGLMVTTPVMAQAPAGYVIPNLRAPRDPLPRFTIAPRGSPLGPIGLPLPRIGLQPPLVRPEHGHRRNGRHVFPWPAIVFYVPQPVIVEPPPQPAPRRVEPPPAGRLILEVQPDTAQVYAGGYYVGTPADFSAARGGGQIDPGLHRIDVSAEGFEPTAVDVRVVPGQTVTYRAALKPLPPAVAVPPSTFDLIPGCYMGNIPPKDAKLPPTCDQSRVVTWRP